MQNSHFSTYQYKGTVQKVVRKKCSNYKGLSLINELNKKFGMRRIQEFVES